MASKYTITLVDQTYGDTFDVPEYNQVRVARAIVALDSAERKFARMLDEIQYNRYG